MLSKALRSSAERGAKRPSVDFLRDSGWLPSLSGGSSIGIPPRSSWPPGWPRGSGSSEGLFSGGSAREGAPGLRPRPPAPRLPHPEGRGSPPSPPRTTIPSSNAFCVSDSWAEEIWQHFTLAKSWFGVIPFLFSFCCASSTRSLGWLDPSCVCSWSCFSRAPSQLSLSLFLSPSLQGESPHLYVCTVSLFSFYSLRLPALI